MKCAHRWVIETPAGTTMVSGYCRVCGATRQFRASWDEEGELASKWGKDHAHARTANPVRKDAGGWPNYREVW
jgi:hypothetical protein